jgi:hypothetical protein
VKVSDSSTYLEAAALKGEVTVTIEAVRPIGKDDKGLDGRPMNKKNVVITYKGATKPHVACRTAQKQIRAALAAEHGGGENAWDDQERWIGKQITLFTTTCNAFGNPNTPCIRVRVPSVGGVK